MACVRLAMEPLGAKGGKLEFGAATVARTLADDPERTKEALELTLLTLDEMGVVERDLAEEAGEGGEDPRSWLSEEERDCSPPSSFSLNISEPSLPGVIGCLDP